MGLLGGAPACLAASMWKSCVCVCMCRLRCQLIGPLLSTLGTSFLPKGLGFCPRDSGGISLGFGIQQQPELHSLPLRSV